MAPSCSPSQWTASRTAWCSTGLARTRVRAGSASRRDQYRPFTARLSASVPPEVKTTSLGRAPSASARVSRASSTVRRALRPEAWREEALPVMLRWAVIASTASGSIGVVAAWSRYAMVTPILRAPVRTPEGRAPRRDPAGPQKLQETVLSSCMKATRTSRSAMPSPRPRKARPRRAVPRHSAAPARAMAIGPRNTLSTSSPTRPRMKDATAMPSASRRPVGFTAALSAAVVLLLLVAGAVSCMWVQLPRIGRVVGRAVNRQPRTVSWRSYGCGGRAARGVRRCPAIRR